jgi:hypothetical protein
VRSTRKQPLARFLGQCSGLTTIGVEGSYESGIVLDAIYGHIQTLRKLELDIHPTRAVLRFCERILRDGAALEKLRLKTNAHFQGYDTRDFISALKSSRLRSLRITGEGHFPGLVEAIPKTLLHQLSYSYARGLSEELGARWLRVLEVLLSVPLVPRISVSAAVRSLPLADLASRIAATLGWPVKRGALTN